MGSRSNKERARCALDAMMALGFTKKEATPVLRNLLNLFDHCWEPIEDECYRALADAILDARDRPQEPGHGGQITRKVAAEDGRHQSSTSLIVHGRPCNVDSETDTPRVKRPRNNSTNFIADYSIDTHSPLFTREAPDGMPPSVTTHERARKMMDEDFQHAVFLREPKPEPDLDMDVSQSLYDTQVGIIQFNTSSSGAAPQNPPTISGNKGRPGQHCRSRTTSTSFDEPMNSLVKQPYNQRSNFDRTAVMHNTETGSADMQETPCLHTVIASSAAGEVKMSIKCSIDPSKFHMPDLEAVFRMVEDKFLRSHKILPPKFSIGSMINEICQCVAQLGSEHTAEHNVQPDAFDNGRNPRNESVASAAPLACMDRVGGKYKSTEETLILETPENLPADSTVVQDLALSHPRPIHDASDISKGEERARISVVNEFGSEKCPPSFHYIAKNLVSKKAYAKISTARISDNNSCADCIDNCLSTSIPCACASVTGGGFAYTPDGLVRTAFLDECASMSWFPEKHHKFFCKSCPLERSRNQAPSEPCRGHLVRKFIKECCSKCGCNMQCGNRVVQRGIVCNLQVFSTREGKGWGLRTLDKLPKGAFVCEYVGELLTITELHERTAQNVDNAGYISPVLLDADWRSEGVLKDEDALCLDATFHGNVGRFINHRCYDANLVEIPIEVETPGHHYYHLALFTTKKVEAFEELTWDYGIDFDDNKRPGEAFECLCGSRYCRGRKRPRNRGKGAAK